jgi:uncharacterized protein YdcH (DUF465 family)
MMINNKKNFIQMDTYSCLNSQSNILHKIQSEQFDKINNLDSEFNKLFGIFNALNKKYCQLVNPFDSTYKQMNSEFDRFYSEKKECFKLLNYQRFYFDKALSEYDFNCEIFKLKSNFFYEIFEKIRINNELNRLISKYETHIQDHENLDISKILKKIFISNK